MHRVEIGLVAMAAFVVVSLADVGDAQAIDLSWKRISKNTERMFKDVVHAPKKVKKELRRVAKKVKAEGRRAKLRTKKLIREIKRIAKDIKKVGRVLARTKKRVRKIGKKIERQVRDVKPAISKTLGQLEKAKKVLRSKEARKRLFAKVVAKQLTGALVKLQRSGKLNRFLDKKVFNSQITVFDLLAPRFSIYERLDPTGIRECTRLEATKRGVESMHKTQKVPEPRVIVAQSAEHCVFEYLSKGSSSQQSGRPVGDQTAAEKAALEKARKEREAELARLTKTEQEKKRVAATEKRIKKELAKQTRLLAQLGDVASELSKLDKQYEAVGKRAAELVQSVTP